MTLLTTNGSLFKKILQVFCKLSPQVFLRVSEEGLKISSISENHLAVLYGHLSKKFFNNYEHDEQYVIIDSATLKKVLDRVKSSRISFDLTGSRIRFSLDNERSFIINSIEKSESIPMFKELSDFYVFKIKADLFDTIIRDVSAVNDEMIIKVKSKRLFFEARNKSVIFFCEYPFTESEVKNEFSVSTFVDYPMLILPLMKETKFVYIRIAPKNPVIFYLQLDESGSSIKLISSSDVYRSLK